MADNKIHTVGILTSGGDAPGMNAAIRAVVRESIINGMSVKGIQRGYTGLLNEEITDMDKHSVSDIIQRGGTILGTARCEEMKTEEGQAQAAEICKKHGIDCLVVIGGDGSYRGALALSRHGINAIGIPGTIDLDIACTDYTIGFDTAINTAMQAIDKVRDTSSSHERCSIIEVMGRNAGYIALWCGIANGAEDILLPEKYDYDEQKIVDNIINNRKHGKKHHIIINAEGIGHSTSMARRIEAATGIETRATILGYMQRGGSPTTKDRFYGSIMGAYAADIVAEGKRNRVISFKGGEVVDIDIEEALAMQKTIPEYHYKISQKINVSHAPCGAGAWRRSRCAERNLWKLLRLLPTQESNASAPSGKSPESAVKRVFSLSKASVFVRIRRINFCRSSILRKSSFRRFPARHRAAISLLTGSDNGRRKPSLLRMKSRQESLTHRHRRAFLQSCRSLRIRKSRSLISMSLSIFLRRTYRIREILEPSSARRRQPAFPR